MTAAQPPSATSWPLQLLLPPSHGDGLVRDTVWNAVVNGAAAGMSFLVLLLTARLSGEYWCGVAALALAMSQQLFTLGNFTMGNYQASDVAEKRAFGDYVAAKVLTVTAMAGAAALWLALDWPGRNKALCFLWMLVYQASDAFSNVFFSRYQQKGRLDTACRIRASKIVLFILVYAGVLAATRNPLSAFACASVLHVALFFALDLPLLRFFGPLGFSLPGRASCAILLACAPLALNSFLLMSVNNAPRFAVDARLGEEALAAYSALFMVSFAVAVCADFLMNPQVVRLAEAIRRGDAAAARRTLLQPLGAIALLGVTGLAVAATFGAPLLSAIFGLDLKPYRATLCIALGGGVFIALYQLAQTVLVVLRRQVWGLPGMALASVTSFFLAKPLVARYGLGGAALSYALATAILAACSTFFAVTFFRRTHFLPADTKPCSRQ